MAPSTYLYITNTLRIWLSSVGLGYVVIATSLTKQVMEREPRESHFRKKEKKEKSPVLPSQLNVQIGALLPYPAERINIISQKWKFCRLCHICPRMATIYMENRTVPGLIITCVCPPADSVRPP